MIYKPQCTRLLLTCCKHKNTWNQTAFPVLPKHNWPVRLLWPQKVWALLPIREQLVVANDGLVTCPLTQFSSDIICLESGWGTMRDGSVLKTGQPLSYWKGLSQAPGCFTSASNWLAWFWVLTTPLALICLRNSEYSGKHVLAWNECRDCIGSSSKWFTVC